MKKILIVFILFLLYKNIFAQTYSSWNSLFSDLISKKQIIFLKKGNSSIAKQFLYKDSLVIKYNRMRLSPLDVNGKKIKDDSVLLNNAEVKRFSFKSNEFICIPAQLSNCLGSFCRLSMCYLLDKTSTSLKLFKFTFREIPESFLFGDIDGDKYLDGLEIFNSFNTSRYFTQEELAIIPADSNGIIYKIYAISLIGNKWHRIKQKNKDCYILVLKEKSDSNDLKIIYSNWPMR